MTVTDVLTTCQLPRHRFSKCQSLLLKNSPSEEYAHPWPDDHVFKCIILFFFSQSYIEQGLFTFTYGQGDSVVDFVHVNNLVQAHVLAGEALHASKNAIAVSI